MKIMDRLMSESKDIWAHYHEHPFVTGICDGSLDIEKFKFYMIQDYLYLSDYAKVFALGVAKATDTDTMRVFAGYIHQILDSEMDIHRGYMERLGISRADAESTPVSADNAYYTSYMLRAAYEGGAPEVIAAILSCAVSYEHIAKKIVERNPKAPEHEFYGEWVSGYASDEYAEANRALEAHFEKLTCNLPEERLNKLTEIFVVCSRLEEMFWDMAWEMRR